MREGGDGERTKDERRGGGERVGGSDHSREGERAGGGGQSRGGASEVIISKRHDEAQIECEILMEKDNSHGAERK